MSERRLRTRMHRQLDPEYWPGEGISPLNRVIMWVVLIGIAVAVLESERTVYERAPDLFVAANAVFAARP